MLSDYIEIGEVLKPQGVHGQVKVRPDTDEPEQFLGLTALYIRDTGKAEAFKALTVEAVSVRDGYVYLTLDGADTRDRAEKQRGLTLYVDRAHARKLRDDEWFICDLIGCRVRTSDGHELGELTDVLSPGANHVFVVTTDKGRLLVAAVKAVIRLVDTAGKLIVLDADKLKEVAVYE